jgi:hypothetical protein
MDPRQAHSGMTKGRPYGDEKKAHFDFFLLSLRFLLFCHVDTAYAGEKSYKSGNTRWLAPADKVGGIVPLALRASLNSLLARVTIASLIEMTILHAWDGKTTDHL